ncbi:hypothetical protein [Scytonema hofmannii]|uniref:hypothetical protein n=1 Tax=Scytonema hofmannii TaxID=34078 RepID=UPI00234E9133|nr:hypothetical protein [Scytonema hofmannii]
MVSFCDRINLVLNACSLINCWQHSHPMETNVMLDEPVATGTDEENHQVTAIISHLIRPGREQGYEEWLHGIIPAAKQFDGHMGVVLFDLAISLIQNTLPFCGSIATLISKNGCSRTCGVTGLSDCSH